jgi:two-component system response regulator VanR
MGEGAVEGEDANWLPRAAAVAAMTTSRPATRILRIRIRRVVVRAGSLQVMLPVKAAWCCQHVCGSRYADDMCRLVASRGMRVLVVEDEPYMAEAIRDGLRMEAIAADIAGDGDTALELLSVNAYDIAVLDRDIPGPSGDEIAKRIVASGSGMPILMLTAADRLDDKASGFALGADDYLTKPFALRELVLRLRALDRRRVHNRPPVREIAGLRLDPFRREVYRGGRYVALTRKQFAVLEVLVAAEGGVVSAEELLERAWDGNADPFTNAVRITVSALRKRLGEPWIIATVAGVGYRIDTEPDTGREGGERG